MKKLLLITLICNSIILTQPRYVTGIPSMLSGVGWSIFGGYLLFIDKNPDGRGQKIVGGVMTVLGGATTLEGAYLKYGRSRSNSQAKKNA